MIWSSGAANGVKTVVNGTVYTTSRLPFDAPAADVSGLVAIGAISVMQSGLGDRPGNPHQLNRPSTATVGALYLDLDRQHAVLVSDGDYWRDSYPGEIVHSHGSRT